MTKEEAIKRINDIRRIYAQYVEIVTENENEALDMAIEALEQEPILNKIRAEILNDWQIKKFPSSPFSCGLRYALAIIDKYRGEEDETNN